MSADLSNLQSVYDKWEAKAPVTTNPANGKLRNSTSADERTRKVIQEGRLKWKKKFGDAPRPVIQRKTRSTLPKLTSTQVIQRDNLSSFKRIASIKPDDFKIPRLFCQHVCKCIEVSHRELVKPQFAEYPLCDMLNVDRHLRRASRISSYFSHWAFITHRRTYFTYTDVTEKVLASSRLKKAIEDKANQNTETMSHDKVTLTKISQLTDSISKTLHSMKARMSNAIMIFSGWVLMKFFTRLLTHIQYHSGQMQLIKALSNKGMPIVYLPTHRSHLDYILITVILWLHNVKVPHIAAGENLNLPVFSYFMKRQGAFFIRRRLDKNPGQKDTVYRAMLHSYMEEILKAGESLEFFIEGGRSRTGKPCQPKAGLLSVVVESYMQGVIDDAYVVPVTINYERILEGTYSHELMGKLKEKETFVNVMKGLWHLFTSQYGTVRIDFLQPFSLREYFRATKDDQSRLTYSDSDAVTTPTHRQSIGGRLDSYSSGDFCLTNQRSYINNLAHHVVYYSMKSTTLMCTNLVAFLLITKHRQGTSMRELVDSFVFLAYQLKHKYRQDVSFTGDPSIIVPYACKLLRSCVIFSESHRISPNLSLPTVFDLMYYANAITPVFVLESVVCCSVLSLTGLSTSIVQSGCLIQSSMVNRQSIITSATRLCDLLNEEFLFISPCMKLETVICETIDNLVISELLSIEESTTISGVSSQEEAQWAKRFVKRNRWTLDEDESDDEPDRQYLRLNLSRNDLIDKILTCHRIIAPYAEALCLAVDHLLSLDITDIPADTFINKIHSEAVHNCMKGSAFYSEHVSMQTIQNSVRTLINLKYIHSYYAGTLLMISRNDVNESDQRLHSLRQFLQSLVY